MPRSKSQTRTDLVDNALKTFWKMGYHAASMGDLVRDTGVNRAAIYSDFSGKGELFLACLDRYQATVVSTAFAPVESPDAGLDAIHAYLSILMDRFETARDFGAGCLIANTLAQIGPDDTKARQRIAAHGDRLKAGFIAVLSRENASQGHLSKTEIDDLANFTMISVQGLWAYSRSVSDVRPLRQYCDQLIAALKTRLHGEPS